MSAGDLVPGLHDCCSLTIRRLSGDRKYRKTAWAIVSAGNRCRRQRVSRGDFVIPPDPTRWSTSG